LLRRTASVVTSPLAFSNRAEAHFAGPHNALRQPAAVKCSQIRFATESVSAWSSTSHSSRKWRLLRETQGTMRTPWLWAGSRRAWLRPRRCRDRSHTAARRRPEGPRSAMCWASMDRRRSILTPQQPRREPVKWLPSANVGIGGCVSPQPKSIPKTQQFQWIAGFLSPGRTVAPTKSFHNSSTAFSHTQRLESSR
jgi:hypothetical protein